MRARVSVYVYLLVCVCAMSCCERVNGYARVRVRVGIYNGCARVRVRVCVFMYKGVSVRCCESCMCERVWGSAVNACIYI